MRIKKGTILSNLPSLFLNDILNFNFILNLIKIIYNLNMFGSSDRQALLLLSEREDKQKYLKQEIADRNYD